MRVLGRLSRRRSVLRHIFPALLLGAAASLTACGSGGSNSVTVAEAGNITFDGPLLRHENTVFAGQHFTLHATVITETPKFNVGVSLDIVPLGAGQTPADVDPDAASYDDDAFALGGGVFDLPIGTHEVTLDLYVPPDVPPGPYAVVLHINRNDTTSEDDDLQRETDAQLLDNVIVSDVVLQVIAATLPNLRFVDCRLARPVHDPLEGERTQVPEEFAPEPYLGIPVQVAVVVEAQCFDVPAGTELKVEAFDPETEGWIPVVLLDPNPTLAEAVFLPEFRVDVSAGATDPVTVENSSTHQQGVTLDVLVPEFLVDPSTAEGEDVVVRLRVLLDPDDDVDEQGELGDLAPDNVCEVEATFLGLPPPVIEPMAVALVLPFDLRTQLWSGDTPRPLTSRDGGTFVLENARRYDTYSGGGNFGSGATFGSSASWQNAFQSTDANLPAQSTLYTAFGHVYVDVWNNRHRALDVRGGAIAHPCGPTFQAGFEARVFGLTLFSTYNTTAIEFEHEWSRDVKASAWVWVGPIPVKVEAGVEGSLGISGSVSLSGGPGYVLAASVGPSTSLTGFATASIDALFVAVGVTAAVNVFDVSLSADANLHVACPGGGGGGPSFDVTVPWSVSTLDGRIYVWVRYPAPVWYDIFRTETQTWNLVNWSGWGWSGTLWSFAKEW